ncbi:hypothetical protein LJR013_003196 [Pseudarthrobacter oxydans]|uniref:hypothetical protein n=1 Tax=Pseudarthrobacter oxydans TaxID=1671 RepID=UPI003ECCA9B2
MTGDALASAFEALITGVTVYRDKVPASPSFPYVFVLTNFPTVAGRAVNRRAQFHRLRSRTTVVGLTGSSVRIVAQKLSNALEGKRPTVAGWSLGAIESVPNEQPIQPDTDVTITGTNQNPLYQPFDWILTGSKTT